MRRAKRRWTTPKEDSGDNNMIHLLEAALKREQAEQKPSSRTVTK